MRLILIHKFGFNFYFCFNQLFSFALISFHLGEFSRIKDCHFASWSLLPNLKGHVLQPTSLYSSCYNWHLCYCMTSVVKSYIIIWTSYELSFWQPDHLLDDADSTIHKLGADRAQKGPYMFKSLLSGGALLAFGSDWPVKFLQYFISSGDLLMFIKILFKCH